VTIGSETSPAVHLENMEVVAGVVPAFFSPEEDMVVYEQGRQIFVRELATGTVRQLGPGIAPRPLPFTADFVFLREDRGRQSEERERTRVSYDVFRASFAAAGPAPVAVGTLLALAEMVRHGNYSPARWLQVAEQGSRFTLAGDGAETYLLPNPFAGAD
jgi:hypothetical protein